MIDRVARLSPLLVIGMALAIIASCTEPTPSVHLTLTAATPTILAGIVSTEVDSPPAVRVTNEDGSPVADVPVRFFVTAGLGIVEGGDARSDADGVARVKAWKLGLRADTQTVTAQSSAVPGQSIVFAATAKPGSVAQIRHVSGAQQMEFVEATLPSRLTVRVTDAFGNDIERVQVTFAVISGGGTIAGAVATTDAAGIAVSGEWTLGPTEGEQRVEARAQNVTVDFPAIAVGRCSVDCPTGRLAFVRDGDIYTVNADGGNMARLTNDARSAEPAWSPDGRRIAFSRDPWPNSEVAIMNADGLSVSPVAPSARTPAWSPDGNHLTFSALRAGTSVIQTVLVDNPGVPTIIGFDRGFNAWPAWSPDTSRIAFVSDWTMFDFASEVYIAGRGEAPVQLTNGFLGGTGPEWMVFSQPAWSPDGSRIAIVACTEWQSYSCAISSLAVMNADGSGLRTLVATAGFARPAWSPDGKRIAFARTCWNHDCPSAIFSVSADGKDERVMIPNAHSPSWRR